jgi:hypothetical protein
MGYSLEIHVVECEELLDIDERAKNKVTHITSAVVILTQPLSQASKRTFAFHLW